MSRAPSPQLTPRSKIKAMLAALDNDSEPESPRQSAQHSFLAGKHQATFNLSSREALGKDGAESSTDEDEVVAPRGKLAARLRGKVDAEEGNKSDGGSQDDRVMAYERVRKQLFRKEDEHTCQSTTIEGLGLESGSTSMTRRLLTRKKPQPSTHGVEEKRHEPIIEADSTVRPDPLAAEGSESDSDLPANPATDSRLLALVAKKKVERQTRQAEEEGKRAGRVNAQELTTSVTISDLESEDGDAVAARRLTQESKPTRKASKKAIEEISRETQRISRSMQLAHEAKTRKKITKESLLARFNFRQGPAMASDALQQTGSSSAATSDVEIGKEYQTPLTSPAGPEDGLDKAKARKFAKSVAQIAAFEAKEEVPELQEMLAQTASLDKGKGKAVVAHLVDFPAVTGSQNNLFTQRPIRVSIPKNTVVSKTEPESDSDLEIVSRDKTRERKSSIFTQLPIRKAPQEHAFLKLRALAHLTSPGKRNDPRKSSMSPAEMQISLQRRARQQAAKERAERVQELRARGVIIQTAEEREQDQVAIENLLEKARREAHEMAKREKDESMKERQEAGQDPAIVSSDEDEDYDEDAVSNNSSMVSATEDEDDDENAEQHSDDEDEDSEEEDVEQECGIGDSNVIDGVASESEKRGEEHEEDDENEDLDVAPLPFNRRHRPARIIADDEDDPDAGFSSFLPQSVPNEQEFSKIPFIPNISGIDAAPMGLTQAFAATMANSQFEEEPEEDSLAMFREMPEPDFAALETIPTNSMVGDSQTQTGPALDLHLTQSQMDEDTLQKDVSLATQFSEIPDPTQDAGFGVSSPAPDRFVPVPPSTVGTVCVNGGALEEAVKRRGRLRRRAELVAFSDSEDDASERQDSGDDAAISAFDLMKGARINAKEAELFAKKNSKAKFMVEDQAEESEDEYAGLGGASDDESAGDEDEEVRQMMDDGEVELNEQELASFYAGKEREKDEKAVEKLFRDINHGMLRRKRGAEFDLSDSDDDIEARRRIKRREFARMRKALLQNEHIGKIAEDPKKAAFLRAIEDREDDEDADSLGEDEISPREVTDPQAATITTAHSGHKRKRPLEESNAPTGNRPPPAVRRVRKTKKPSTLAEIRESLSFLMEEPNMQAEPSFFDVSADENDEPGRAESAYASRRRANPIIDRLSLKRFESSAAYSTSTRLAFHDPHALAAPGFRVPSLLRRANTQLTEQGDNHGITMGKEGVVGTERAAGGEKGDFVRRGGTKKSSINYFARETERRKVVDDVERRREEERKKIARGRRGLTGVLRRGGFD